MMPSTGRTLRQKAGAGIKTARHFWQQAASYLREKRFQQHPIYQKLMPFFRFLIGVAYSTEVRAYKRRLCDQLVRLSLLLLGKTAVVGRALTALVAGYLDSVYVFYDFSMACLFDGQC
jgi:hypothetical protein